MNRKRTLAHVLTVLLFSASMTLLGCQEQSNELDPENPTKITVWHYYNGAQSIAFDELVMDFNNTVGTKKGIIVESASKSSVDDLIAAVTESALKKPGAEDLPNIFQCYLDTAVSLDELDILANLDAYITEEEKSAYIDSYISEGTFGAENEFKLFPIAKSTELLVVNETAFAPFAASTGCSIDDLATWEGIAATAQKYYEYSGGKSFFGRDAFANYMIIGSLQLGEEIFQVENGNVTVNINKDAMKCLWDNYYIPYIKGYYQHTGRFRTDDIKIGSIIAAVGSNPGMSYLPSEITDDSGTPVEISYQILPVPDFEGTDSYAVQQGASMAVTKASVAEEYASIEFLKWFTSEEINIDFSISSGYLPVLKSSNNMDKIDAYLQDGAVSLSELEYDVLETAITQAANSTLYTSKGFSNGFAARTLLSNSMIDLAVADRETILSGIAAGTPEEDVLAPYLEESNFNNWYQNFSDQMNETCME